jgi:hypothetical protein
VLKKWVEANYEELPRGVVDLLLAFVRGRLLRQRQPAYAPMVRLVLQLLIVFQKALADGRTISFFFVCTRPTRW